MIERFSCVRFFATTGLLVIVAITTYRETPNRIPSAVERRGLAPELVGLAELLSLRREPGLVLVDARPAVAFARARIGGAINVAPDMARSLSTELLLKLSSASAIVVYCDSASCGSAIVVWEVLAAQGIKHASVYSGGINEWKAAGLEMEINK